MALEEPLSYLLAETTEDELVLMVERAEPSGFVYLNMTDNLMSLWRRRLICESRTSGFVVHLTPVGKRYAALLHGAGIELADADAYARRARIAVEGGDFELIPLDPPGEQPEHPEPKRKRGWLFRRR